MRRFSQCSRFNLKTDFQRLGRVGYRAYGDAIDAGEGDGADGFQRDSAGVFEQQFALTPGRVRAPPAVETIPE